MKGAVEIFEIESEALKANVLGDPSRREVLVYLPPGHEAGEAFFSTLLLPAYGSNHRTFLNYDLWQPSVLEQLDALVRDGNCPRTCVIIPDCRTRWGGSQFINSPASGNYQDFVVDEVFAAVDARYNTRARAQGRAVVGRSSGGFGALRLAMDRPDVVGAAGSIAGDAAFELSLQPLILKAQIAFEQSGGVEPFCQRLVAEGPSRGSDYDAAFLLAAASAYAPHSTPNVPHAPLPFDPVDGKVDQALWEAWMTADPCARFSAKADSLRALKLLHVEAGRFDEYGLQYAARRLAQQSRESGVRVSHEEFDGGHRGTRARYLQVIPRLLRALQN